MNESELRHAAENGIPVVYENKLSGYRIIGQVTAVIQRYSRNSTAFRAELKDINSNSIYVCDPNELKIWDGYVKEASKQ